MSTLCQKRLPNVGVYDHDVFPKYINGPNCFANCNFNTNAINKLMAVGIECLKLMSETK